MAHYEYKVIPAPVRGRKAPGVKQPEARFALALEDRMNALAADGWDYHRADILPSEERQGLASTHTVYRSVLVFRRLIPAADPALAQPAATRPGPPTPDARPLATPAPAPEPAEEPDPLAAARSLSDSTIVAYRPYDEPSGPEDDDSLKR